ncbi:MAG: MoxR family ATPase [Chloroflexi bacterium]|nr:MoxR family ATPase [Chloroflexota bacterium]
MTSVQGFANRVLASVEQVILGKRPVIEKLLVAFLCDGHVLIEDVPGVGKTMLARALAASMDCTFRRIQFTPDMLPSDVTGVSIFNLKTQEFEFRAGPIMAELVLADEINRAPPKTQAALLEAMEERQVTVEGKTHPLPRPFLVLATQNPIEYEGTFPLPEAQLDRFMMRVRIGYPTKDEEVRILESQRDHHPIEDVRAVVSREALLEAQAQVRQVYVDERVKEYIVDLVRYTRHHPAVYLGASPRGSLFLYKGARAWAAMHGRDYVLPDDVKMLAPDVLAHRIIIQPEARVQGVRQEEVIQEILDTVPVPGGLGEDGR